MPREVEFTISWTAIAKLLLAILVAYLLVRLWPLIELLLLTLLIAIAFNPLVHWTHKHNWRCARYGMRFIVRADEI